MSVFKVVSGAPGWLLGRVVTVVGKVVPGPVKRWVVGQVAGAAATKVGGELRRQVEKEKAMEPTTPGTKPGHKTTEFWLTCLAQVVSGLYASGAIGDGTAIARILGFIATMLVTAGYTVSRGVAKSGSAEPTKPGWQTTEFWLTLASTVVALATGSGAVVGGTVLGKVVELAATVLGLLGYVTSRGIAKSKIATGLIIAPAGPVSGVDG